MTHSSYQYSFEKHTYPIEEFERDQAQLGIRGAIGFTSDPARQNFFHRVISFVQSRFKDAVDPRVFHGFILMENDKREEKKDHLVVGEVGFVGIRTASKHYSKESRPHIQFMSVYTPSDPRIQEALIKAIDITAFNQLRAKSDEEYAKRQRKPLYASRKLVASLFQTTFKQSAKIDHSRRIHTLAMTLADLILERQLTEKNGKDLRNFHCVGYTMTLLQGVSLLVQLTDQEKQAYALLDRDQLIEKLVRRISGKRGQEDALRQTYLQNPYCQINAASCMPAYGAYYLDQQVNKPVAAASQPEKVHTIINPLFRSQKAASSRLERIIERVQNPLFRKKRPDSLPPLSSKVISPSVSDLDSLSRTSSEEELKPESEI